MKCFFRSLILLALLGSSTAHANLNSKRGNWGVELEYLYLLPMISQCYYTIPAINNNANNPSGNRQNNELNFQSAYRLKGAYRFCNETNLQLYWTHLPKFSSTDTTTGVLLPTQGSPGVLGGNLIRLANSHINYEFFAVDALIGFWNYQCNCLELFFQTGLHYANFNFHETIQYTTIAGVKDIVNNETDLWGVGPEVAFEMHFGLPFLQRFLCGCGELSFASGLRGAILSSRYHPHYNFTQLSPAGSLNILLKGDDERRWDFVQFWDIRLGLNYVMAFSCFTASLEVGYEMFSYRNAIARVNYVDDLSDGISFDLYSDANFQGPYVALGFAF